MLSKLSRIVKLQALELDAQGYDQHDIGEILAISVGIITKAKRKMKAIDDVEGGQQKRGPKRKGRQSLTVGL